MTYNALMGTLNPTHSLTACCCGLCCADQLQQLASQPNGQTRVDAERKLQKQKQDLDQQLSQKAQQLLQMRLVRCFTIVVLSSALDAYQFFSCSLAFWVF